MEDRGDERRTTHTAAISAGKQTIAEEHTDDAGRGRDERIGRRVRELDRRLRRLHGNQARQG